MAVNADIIAAKYANSKRLDSRIGGNQGLTSDPLNNNSGQPVAKAITIISMVVVSKKIHRS